MYYSNGKFVICYPTLEGEGDIVIVFITHLSFHLCVRLSSHFCPKINSDCNENNLIVVIQGSKRMCGVQKKFYIVTRIEIYFLFYFVHQYLVLSIFYVLASVIDYIPINDTPFELHVLGHLTQKAVPN